MALFDYDIGIIGGPARLGARTLLIEREPLLGGDCLHYGCVPSKTLIRAAHVYHTLRQTEFHGLPGAEIGPVDFARVAARIRDVIATIGVHDSVERFRGPAVSPAPKKD